MLYRLAFTYLFFLTFAIQARMVHVPLAHVPYYAFAAAWLMIVSTRKAAILKELNLIRKEIKKRAA